MYLRCALFMRLCMQNYTIIQIATILEMWRKIKCVWMKELEGRAYLMLGPQSIHRPPSTLHRRNGKLSTVHRSCPQSSTVQCPPGRRRTMDGGLVGDTHGGNFKFLTVNYFFNVTVKLNNIKIIKTEKIFKFWTKSNLSLQKDGQNMTSGRKKWPCVSKRL